jgi:hypothetical protein
MEEGRAAADTSKWTRVWDSVDCIVLVCGRGVWMKIDTIFVSVCEGGGVVKIGLITKRTNGNENFKKGAESILSLLKIKNYQHNRKISGTGSDIISFNSNDH